MTNEQKSEVANKVRSEISEALEVGSVACSTILDVLDENPELIENVGQLVAKYWTVFRPMLQEVTKDVISTRKAAFLEFKAMGLTDELAVKLTTGC